MQSALRILYPPQCLNCAALVDTDDGLCGPCWRDARFIAGASCAKCGAGLPGEAPGDNGAVCDDCLAIARPWRRGVSVVAYAGTGRRLVLALKHGDRTDLAAPLAGWMLRRAPQLIGPATVVVPVPVPWRRLAARRFNQAALLSRHIAAGAGIDWLPDALIRRRHTPPQEGMTRDARFALQMQAIGPHPRRRGRIAGREVLLVDDVMTTGATLAAATEALHAGGAACVDVLTLARVAKDD